MLEMALAFNLIAILLTLFGTALAYYNAPPNNSVINGGNAATNFDEIAREDARKNSLSKLGFVLILVGVFFQVVALLAG